MKLRFPLFTKIVGWFFLNLLLIGVLLGLFFQGQFRFGLDFLLAGRAGERIQALTELLVAELNTSPGEEWDGILERFSNAYQLPFYLYRNDGQQAAGKPMVLPPEVRGRLNEGRGPGLQRPMGTDRPDFPPGPRDRIGADRRGPRQQPPEPVIRRPFAKFLVKSENPSKYWLVVRIPVPDKTRPRPGPMALIVESDTLRGGGLFLDFTPWLWAGVAVVGLSLLFWFPLVRGITRAIGQLTHATERMAEGDFETRVVLQRRDELGRLGSAVNTMAGRLAGFVSGQKRFLGDIAHELCSPIARIQMALGILEQRADEKQKAYVEDVREEVQHMSSLVNELLSFSKAGLREKQLELILVQLAPLVRKAVERETGGNGGVTVLVSEDIQAFAEPELLSRAVANLVRNALRYGGNDKPITVSASKDGERVVLTVTDEGPGVPEAMLQQIFDPFFRVESSRSRDTGGIGLGLAIVKTCVEACRGTVTAHNRRPHGLEVVISLKAG